MTSDAKQPSDAQRRKLCDLLFEVFLEMRMLSWSGHTEQAADLADTFHNLPHLLHSDDFSLPWQRQAVESYYQRWPPSHEPRYLLLLDEVARLA